MITHDVLLQPLQLNLLMISGSLYLLSRSNHPRFALSCLTGGYSFGNDSVEAGFSMKLDRLNALL